MGAIPAQPVQTRTKTRTHKYPWVLRSGHPWVTRANAYLDVFDSCLNFTHVTLTFGI